MPVLHEHEGFRRDLRRDLTRFLVKPVPARLVVKWTPQKREWFNIKESIWYRLGLSRRRKDIAPGAETIVRGIEADVRRETMERFRHRLDGKIASLAVDVTLDVLRDARVEIEAGGEREFAEALAFYVARFIRENYVKGTGMELKGEGVFRPRINSLSISEILLVHGFKGDMHRVSDFLAGEIPDRLEHVLNE